jgi:hypothetical protein
MPRPCRAAKGLEYVFPIWFTQCGRVWFTLVMPCPCHTPTMQFFSRPQHSTAVSRRPCCTVALRRMEHVMASVNQTMPHCVNKMGKTHSKPLAARHGRRTACYVWIGLKTEVWLDQIWDKQTTHQTTLKWNYSLQIRINCNTCIRISFL